MSREFQTLQLSEDEGAALRFLYNTAVGRCLLRLFISPGVSRFVGFLLDRRPSAALIKQFIKSNHIDMARFEDTAYVSFNAFFTRQLRPEHRRFPPDANSVCAPCDGKLTWHKIEEGSAFCIKRSRYTLRELLGIEQVEAYTGGDCLIFRLSPDDYHRYCFIDSGRILAQKRIAGLLHTVRPIATGNHAAFHRNTREYVLLEGEALGRFIQMEVGAMFVGRIRNHKREGSFARGEEKGMFEFGGSTVILLFPKGAIQVDPRIRENTANNLETIVHMGEAVGTRCATIR